MKAARARPPIPPPLLKHAELHETNSDNRLSYQIATLNFAGVMFTGGYLGSLISIYIIFTAVKIQNTSPAVGQEGFLGLLLLPFILVRK